MSVAADFGDLMTATVTLEARTADSEYGKPFFSSPVSYSARVSYKTRWIRKPDGAELLAQGMVWLRSNVAVDVQDRLTLPSGAQPPILMVERPADMDGSTIHHTRVTFG